MNGPNPYAPPAVESRRPESHGEPPWRDLAVASTRLGLFVIAVDLALVCIIAFAESPTAVSLLYVTLGVNLVGLGLGIAAVVLKHRRRRLAMLGLCLNTLPLISFALLMLLGYYVASQV